MSDFDKRKKTCKLSAKPTISLEVLQGLFESGSSSLSQQFIRWKLWKKWQEYVGNSIASVSEPVGYKQGTLYVWVKNSTWMQQMIFMLEPIKNTINQKVGFQYVRVIYLTLDRKNVPTSADEMEQLKKHVQSLMKDED